MFFKIIGLFALLSVVCSAQKVKVHVYYESLCGDSRAFINDQLFPLMQNQSIKASVDLNLVPFGKANFTTTETNDVLFTCQHGPEECYGNKIHACAIEQIKNETLTLAFVNCLMKNFRDAVFPGKLCADQHQLTNWAFIEQCANSTDGSQLLKKHGELTHALNPSLIFVPTITLQDKYERETQKQVLFNFRETLCKEFPSPKPSACSGAERNMVASALIAFMALAMTKLF